jgi:hypothetical protein
MAAKLTREEMRAIYRVFQHFALDDQRIYYTHAIERSRGAARQVNFMRAGFALLTGVASALVGTVVAMNSQSCFINATVGATATPTPTLTPTPVLFALQTAAQTPDCMSVQGWVNLLLVIAVVAPALGSAFTTLADLYQWDRVIAIYESALENLDVADAQSPDEEMDDATYLRALTTYAEGTLSVMSDETAQWGQLIKPPRALENFVSQSGRRSLDATPGVPTIPVDSD